MVRGFQGGVIVETQRVGEGDALVGGNVVGAGEGHKTFIGRPCVDSAAVLSRA